MLRLSEKNTNRALLGAMSQVMIVRTGPVRTGLLVDKSGCVRIAVTLRIVSMMRGVSGAGGVPVNRCVIAIVVMQRMPTDGEEGEPGGRQTPRQHRPS